MYSNSTCQCLWVSGAVCLCLVASVVVCWHLLVSGDVWWVSGGCLVGVWGCLSDIQGNRRQSDVFGSILVLSPCSMEPKHYFVTTLKRRNSSHLNIGHQNAKTSQYKVSKNHWVCAVWDFFGSVREILQVTSLFGSPCIIIITEKI